VTIGAAGGGVLIGFSTTRIVGEVDLCSFELLGSS
jgi:hypothetical protein